MVRFTRLREMILVALLVMMGSWHICHADGCPDDVEVDLCDDDDTPVSPGPAPEPEPVTDCDAEELDLCDDDAPSSPSPTPGAPSSPSPTPSAPPSPSPPVTDCDAEELDLCDDDDDDAPSSPSPTPGAPSSPSPTPGAPSSPSPTPSAPSTPSPTPDVAGTAVVGMFKMSVDTDDAKSFSTSEETKIKTAEAVVQMAGNDVTIDQVEVDLSVSSRRLAASTRRLDVATIQVSYVITLSAENDAAVNALAASIQVAITDTGDAGLLTILKDKLGSEVVSQVSEMTAAVQQPTGTEAPTDAPPTEVGSFTQTPTEGCCSGDLAPYVGGPGTQSALVCMSQCAAEDSCKGISYTEGSKWCVGYKECNEVKAEHCNDDGVWKTWKKDSALGENALDEDEKVDKASGGSSVHKLVALAGFGLLGATISFRE